METGQIGVASVIRQVVPGNPETSVSRLVSPRAPLRRGCGTRTLSVDGETKQTLRITLLNRCWSSTRDGFESRAILRGSSVVRWAVTYHR